MKNKYPGGMYIDDRNGPSGDPVRDQQAWKLAYRSGIIASNMNRAKALIEAANDKGKHSLKGEELLLVCVTEYKQLIKDTAEHIGLWNITTAEYESTIKKGDSHENTHIKKRNG